MKKYAALTAVAVLVAFAAPAMAATNPFMDVPMNHWAYDAIGQLAARGVLSGYPDGLYRGAQPTTRYEMASALARALAVVDMTKASKQDVEMLKRLVIEFKDELDALGVKVDQLDRRVAVLEDRLGGWKLSGVMRLDIEHRDLDDRDGYTNLARARLFLDRWFGEDESIHFHARFEGSDGTAGTSAAGTSTTSTNVRWTRFFVEVPVWWDMTLTVGRFLWDMEADYYLDGTTGFGKQMGFGQDAILTDRTVDGLGIQKNFAMGQFAAYAGRQRNLFGDARWTENGTVSSAWELYAVAKLQFSEQFGFDIGGQAFLGDDASTYGVVANTIEYRLNNLYTIFGGLRFNFNEDVALKGIFYYQDSDREYREAVAGGWSAWRDVNTDSANAFKAIVDIKQNLLGFTSLWLEYGQFDKDFVAMTGAGDYMWGPMWAGSRSRIGSQGADLNLWRIAATQKWNDKWSTFASFAQFNYDNVHYTYGGVNYIRDAKATEWTLGFTYQLNPSVMFGLGYANVNWDSDGERAGREDDHVIRFRTFVTF